MSHSKRNTSLAFFTAHERSELKSTWGSQSTRLSRDSFLPFASCTLCLQPARSPVACISQGDIFCRECIVSNLLAQRAEIKRLEKEAERRRREEEEEGGRRAEEERERSVRMFERVGMGMEGATAAATKGKADKRNTSPIPTAAQSEADTRGAKRKFALSEPALLATAQADRLTARAALDAEEAAKPTLPSFWVPSLTPSTHKSSAASISIKQSPICPGSATGKDAHPLSLKAVVDIKFSYSSTAEGRREERGERAKGEADTERPICPACTKPLSNTLRATLATACGHVLCKPCAGKFLTKNKGPDPHSAAPEEQEKARCYVCEIDLRGEDQKAKRKRKREKDREGKEDDAVEIGLVDLRSEGTGFAGGGRNMARREGVAFQC